MINFVNYNTLLPVSLDTANWLKMKTADLADICRLHTHPNDGFPVETSLDIFFVSSPELNQARSGIQPYFTEDENSEAPSTDLLGVYIPCHPKFGRSIVMVSPEKILRAVEQTNCISYFDLLAKVITHEIGHHLMKSIGIDGAEWPWHPQDNLFRSYRYRRRWLVQEDRARYEQKLLTKAVDISRPQPGCATQIRPQIPMTTNRSVHIIEESLANLLPLILSELAYCRSNTEAFVSKQPRAYRAALAYNRDCDLAVVLNQFFSWGTYKATLEEWDTQLNGLVGSTRNYLPEILPEFPLEIISSQLLNNGPVDIREIGKLRDAETDWFLNFGAILQKAWEASSGSLRDFLGQQLNGENGLYRTLITKITNMFLSPNGTRSYSQAELLEGLLASNRKADTE